MQDVSSTIRHDIYRRTTITVTESCLGVLLNLFVAYKLYKSTQFVTPSNLLYIYLLINDTMACLLVASFQASWVYPGRERPPYILCQMGGFFTHFFEAMSVSIIFLQLVNPFRIIVMEKLPLTNRQLTLILIAVLVGSAGLIGGMPFISGDRYVEMPSGIWCYLNFDNPKWGTSTTLYATVLILCLIPLALVASYLLMWYKMRMHHQRLCNAGSSLRHKEKQVQWLVIRRGVIVVLGFMLSWTYPGIIIYGRVFGKWTVTPEQDFWVLVMGLSSNVTNPLILYFSDENIRRTRLRKPEVVKNKLNTVEERGGCVQESITEDINSTVDPVLDIEIRPAKKKMIASMSLQLHNGTTTLPATERDTRHG